MSLIFCRLLKLCHLTSRLEFPLSRRERGPRQPRGDHRLLAMVYAPQAQIFVVTFLFLRQHFPVAGMRYALTGYRRFLQAGNQSV